MEFSTGWIQNLCFRFFFCNVLCSNTKRHIPVWNSVRDESRIYASVSSSVMSCAVTQTSHSCLEFSTGWIQNLCFRFFFCNVLCSNTKRTTSSSNSISDLELKQETGVRHSDALQPLCYLWRHKHCCEANQKGGCVAITEIGGCDVTGIVLKVRQVFQQRS